MAEIYVEGDVRGGGTGDSADAVPPQSTRMIAAAVQGAFFIGGIGFVLLPFVVWIVMRGRNVFVAHHAKQAFLSQLSRRDSVVSRLCLCRGQGTLGRAVAFSGARLGGIIWNLFIIWRYCYE